MCLHKIGYYLLERKQVNHLQRDKLTDLWEEGSEPKIGDKSNRLLIAFCLWDPYEESKELI